MTHWSFFRPFGYSFLCACLLGVLLAPSSAEAVPSKVRQRNNQCLKGLAQGTQKLADEIVKSTARCHRDRLLGRVNAGVDCNDLAALDLRLRDKITKAEAKVAKAATQKCEEADTSAPAVLGFSSCPAPCASEDVTAWTGVGSCLICVARAESGDLSTAVHGSPQVPAASPAVNQCFGNVAKALRGSFGTRTKEQFGCQLNKLRGKAPAATADCAAADLKGKIAKADGKGVASLSRCQDDATVAELGSCGSTVAAMQTCLPSEAGTTSAALFATMFPPAPVIADPADTVLRSGRVYTADPANPWAEAVVIDDGDIVYVGSNGQADAWCDDTTEVLDARGRLVLPGIHDSHMHPLEAGSEVAGTCLLWPETDPEFMINLIANCAPFQVGTNWVMGFGHSIRPMLETTRNPVDILDDAVPNRPAVMMEETSHSVWVNSMALAELGITASTPDPIGGVIGHDSFGEPNGLLFENAGELAIEAALAPTPTLDEFAYQGLVSSMAELAENGITSFVDSRAYRTRNHVEAYERAELEGTLTSRATLALWAYPHFADVQQIQDLTALYSVNPSGMLQVSQIKLYSDGLLDNSTAAMIDPYDSDLGITGPTGMNYFTESRLTDYVTQLELVGFDMQIHAIGDRGAREALNAIESARTTNGLSVDRRHRLTHLEILHADDRPRFASLDVIADFQVAGDFTLPEFWSHNDVLIGTRAQDPVPVRSVHDTGARVVLSSDWDVSSMNPFVGIQNSLNRAQQSLATVDDAVRAYTIDAAYLMRSETRTGSLEVGKHADLIVVNQDIFTVPTTKIGKTKVLLTMVGGNEIYRSGF